MTSNYLIWQNTRVSQACSLTDFEGMENDFPLRSGAPLADSFPDNASFSMHPDNPHDTLLTDSLQNTNMVLVVSQRLADCLQQNNVPQVEYLPVTILDHKGKPTKESYFIAHPIHPVDCLDVQQSRVTWSPILKGNIKKVERLVLDESKIPQDRSLFRCSGFYRVTLVRRDLAAAIDAQQFTGFRWMELEDYK